MHEQNAIESMPLYVNVERIDNELAALGIGADEALTPAQLFPFDQYHYHGTDAVHAAAHLLGLGPTSHVLDVGSGLGGPARYLTSTIGCHVTALELQSELHALATRLTARCGLEQHITHVCGDTLTPPSRMPPSTPSSVGSSSTTSRSARACWRVWPACCVVADSATSRTCTSAHRSLRPTCP